MERTKIKILTTLIIATICITTVCAQNTSIEKLPCYFQETYAAGNLEGWEKAIQSIEKQPALNLENGIVALQARYGFMGYLIGSKQNGRAKKFLEETDKQLDGFVKNYPNNARLLSIKAALYGFKIGLSPLKAPFLGPKNVEALEAAEKINPQEPLLWLEKGNSVMYRPAAFGGSKTEAEKYYRKAFQLLSPAKCNWINKFIEVRLYEACKANGKTVEAETIRRKLQEKPGNFRWMDNL